MITGTVFAMGFRNRRRVAALALAALLCGAGCSAPPADDAEANDPAEGVNRAIFEANLAADRAVLRPIARAYQEHVPQDVQQGVHNIVGNLATPRIAANDLLQGKTGNAWHAVERLAVNTTVGAAGAVDVASGWGLAAHDADFGQTLAIWGLDAGPFVELPFFGPSNVRDAVGTAVDLALDPLAYVGAAAATYADIAASGAKFVDARARHLADLDELERNSLDFYAALRSAYGQHREAEIQAAKGTAQARAGRAATQETP